MSEIAKMNITNILKYIQEYTESNGYSPKSKEVSKNVYLSISRTRAYLQQMIRLGIMKQINTVNYGDSTPKVCWEITEKGLSML